MVKWHEMKQQKKNSTWEYLTRGTMDSYKKVVYYPATLYNKNAIISY